MYTIACASAVRNSNKNLLLSGVFLPSRALAFLTLIKRVRICSRRRLANMYTISGGAILRNHPKISCSRARFTLSDACLYDTYKKRFAYIRGGDLTICILLPACRRRKAKFATPCAMQGVCIQACGSSSPQIVLSFAPPKFFRRRLRVAPLCGDP